MARRRARPTEVVVYRCCRSSCLSHAAATFRGAHLSVAAIMPSLLIILFRQPSTSRRRHERFGHYQPPQGTSVCRSHAAPASFRRRAGRLHRFASTYHRLICSWRRQPEGLRAPSPARRLSVFCRVKTTCLMPRIRPTGMPERARLSLRLVPSEKRRKRSYCLDRLI